MSDGPRPHRILFVCSGNICRSPMAEGIARHQAQERGMSLEVASAGTLMLHGYPADAKAVTACREIGIDIHEHSSQGVSAVLLEWADYTLCMEYQHLHFIAEHLSGHSSQVLLFGPFVQTEEIADPVGRWLKHFRRCREQLVKGTEAFLGRLPPAPANP